MKVAGSMRLISLPYRPFQASMAPTYPGAALGLHCLIAGPSLKRDDPVSLRKRATFQE